MYEQHGLSKHKLHIVWNDIKTRCYNTKTKHYKDYGGRNITMCDEWLNSFLSFYDFCINNGWKEGLEIDRINNDGNYEPNNCQFITHIENNAIGKRRKQNNNKSGYIGVSYIKSRNKWRAKISFNKRDIHLGNHDTIVQAVQARIDAELLYFNEQRTNFTS